MNSYIENKYEVSVLKDKIPYNWNSLVKKFDGTVFDTVEWLNIMEQLFHYKHNFITIEESEKVVGFLCYRIYSPLKFLKVANIYNVFSVNENIRRILFENLDKDLRQSGVVKAISAQESNWHFDPKSYGFTKENEKTHTYILNLKRDEDMLWKSLEKRTRNGVTRAKKEGVKIINVTENKKQLKKFYSMHADTYKRSTTKGFSMIPVPMKQFELMHDVLSPKNMIKTFVAEYQGKIVNGATLLTYNKKIYYWLGASSIFGRNVSPGNLLHWEIIRWGKDDYDTYNFGGINPTAKPDSPQYGINRFKSGFGGDLVTYYQNERIYKNNFNVIMNLLKRIRG